jgi:CubicO group peptidase (beta-lactamase class C family)
MKLIFSCIALLAALLATAQTPQTFKPAKPGEVAVSAKRLARLDSFLTKEAANGLFPHAVTFVARRGQVVHHKAFGYRNREEKLPLRRDDIFRIASQTKAVTTVALLLLMEEGRFLLDDPVSRYIPAFKNPKVLVQYDSLKLTYTTRPAKSEITIRQLLTHTAGIPYEHPLQNHPDFAVPFFNSVDKVTLEEVIPRLAARPLTADPGEKFVYGLNTDVVGYLVEVLSDKSLDVFMQERIFGPLGMKDTYFYLPESKADRLVELYSKPKRDAPLTLHENMTFRKFPVSGARTYFSGGAGLVSTVEDYARFSQMILNGGAFNGKQLLARSTLNLMGTNQMGDLRVWNRGDTFGFGLEITQAGSRYSDLTTPGSLSWGGMYCSEFTIDPHEDLILLVFTNVQPYAHFEEFLRKCRVLVYQALEDGKF